jgi:hypothetical protein
MGSLKSIVLHRETIKVVGGEFTVGPLNVGDIMALFIGHRSHVEHIFDSYRKGEQETDLLINLAVTVPELVAEIIARGAGEPDDEAISKARQLDFGAQLIALEKIALLTVETVGGLGNLAMLIERLSANVKSTLAQPGSPQQSSSTDSAKSAQPSSPQDTPMPTNIPSG